MRIFSYVANIIFLVAIATRKKIIIFLYYNLGVVQIPKKNKFFVNLFLSSIYTKSKQEL